MTYLAVAFGAPAGHSEYRRKRGGSMAHLGRLWAGRLYGTNTGNLFVELNESGDKLVGIVRFLDAAYGPVVYAATGQFSDGRLTLELTPKQAEPSDAYGRITVSATLTADGSLRGEWSSTIGTGGTFQLFPHDPPPSVQARGTSQPAPEQIQTATRTLGAVRLYGQDAKDVIDFVRREFTGRVVVTYSSGGNDVSKYAEDFLAENASHEKLRYLKIFVQEPDAHGINRMVTVELSASGTNTVRVQGVNESWVIGKAEAITQHFRRFESFLLTTYKKFGLGLNQILVLLMLILLPEISPLWLRAVFVVAAVTLFSALVWIHGRLIPNAAIYRTARQPGMLERSLPSVWSFLIAAGASVAAGIVVWWITRDDPERVTPPKPQGQQQQIPHANP